MSKHLFAFKTNIMKLWRTYYY